MYLAFINILYVESQQWRTITSQKKDVETFSFVAQIFKLLWKVIPPTLIQWYTFQHKRMTKHLYFCISYTLLLCSISAFSILIRDNFQTSLFYFKKKQKLRSILWYKSDEERLRWNTEKMLWKMMSLLSDVLFLWANEQFARFPFFRQNFDQCITTGPRSYKTSHR